MNSRQHSFFSVKALIHVPKDYQYKTTNHRSWLLVLTSCLRKISSLFSPISQRCQWEASSFTDITSYLITTTGSLQMEFVTVESAMFYNAREENGVGVNNKKKTNPKQKETDALPPPPNPTPQVSRNTCRHTWPVSLSVPYFYSCIFQTFCLSFENFLEKVHTTQCLSRSDQNSFQNHKQTGEGGRRGSPPWVLYWAASFLASNNQTSFSIAGASPNKNYQWYCSVINIPSKETPRFSNQHFMLGLQSNT